MDRDQGKPDKASVERRIKSHKTTSREVGGRPAVTSFDVVRDIDETPSEAEINRRRRVIDISIETPG